MAKNRTSVLIAVAALIVLITGVVTYSLSQPKSSEQSNNQANSAQKNVHFDITLRDGSLVGPLSNYEANVGTVMEFSINSDRLGQVGVPTDPAQIITFKQSPLVFHFTASNVGTFPITYRPKGTTDVIQIGTVTIR